MKVTYHAPAHLFPFPLYLGPKLSPTYGISMDAKVNLAFIKKSMANNC